MKHILRPVLSELFEGLFELFDNHTIIDFIQETH